MNPDNCIVKRKPLVLVLKWSYAVIMSKQCATPLGASTAAVPVSFTLSASFPPGSWGVARPNGQRPDFPNARQIWHLLLPHHD